MERQGWSAVLKGRMKGKMEGQSRINLMFKGREERQENGQEWMAGRKAEITVNVKLNGRTDKKLEMKGKTIMKRILIN